MLTFKLISTTFFAVLLAGLVPFASTEISFPDFIQKLESHINANRGSLSFNMSFYVLRDLEGTTDQFKSLCLRYDEVNAPFETPATCVQKAIISEFYKYKDMCGERTAKMLLKIKCFDPIGFIAFLRKRNVNETDLELKNCTETYATLMWDRISLLELNKALINCCPSVKSISAEYAHVEAEGFHDFIEVAKKASNKLMYPIDTKVDEYKTYTNKNSNDVQIIGVEQIKDETNSSMWRAICIKYDAYTGKVHIYDSANSGKLDDRHKAIINKLYPECGLKFENPTGHKTDTNCGIFAITYATMLILNRDPATNIIKLNEVYGDETLNLRRIILSMLYETELILPQIEEIHPN